MTSKIQSTKARAERSVDALMDDFVGTSKQSHDPGENKPKCLALFERGIQTCSELAGAMSMLMADLISERVGTSVGNAVCNAGAKMLKASEMQQRFGSATGNGKKELKLIS